MKIKDIAHLNLRCDMYALFGDDGCLYLRAADGVLASIVLLPHISTEGQIQLYVHEPWVCVTERFGTHAALVNLENANVREMSREDYIANACSYSIGFTERNGCVQVIHQTQWNRLDIMDAETGECLTEREVTIREASFAEPDEQWMPPNYAVKNYIDYFHSLLHVSLDGSSFLSNGWIWHPLGQILCFRTNDFQERYELAKVAIEYNHAYNWDIPCTYIAPDRFVIAVDDLHKDARLEAEALEGYQYRQLQFYNLHTSTCETQYGELVLKKEYERDCSAFTLDEEGQVHGQLVWDSALGCLVAITPDGAFKLNIKGEILKSYPECKCAEENHGNTQCTDLGWRYNPESHLLYHWSQDMGMVEERELYSIKE